VISSTDRCSNRAERRRGDAVPTSMAMRLCAGDDELVAEIQFVEIEARSAGSRDADRRS
jgi:hypothetical protein